MSRVAVVTGGTRGIGKAISARLHAEGHRVTALYASHDAEAEQLRAETGVAVLKCDVSAYDQCQNAILTVEQREGPVEILVNNAGSAHDVSLHKMSVEDWDSILRIDLYSIFNMSRQVIGGMRDRRFGRIVNISSVNGQKGQFGQTNYCAAKAGILGFTKALALETAHHGVTVNAIAPGYIDTAMMAGVPPEVLAKIVETIPVGRLGRPEDIARCVSFLTADEADFITGATLSANGGQHMA